MENDEMPPVATPPSVDRLTPPTIEKSKRKSSSDKLSDFLINNPKEYWFGVWNMSLFLWEILRDAGHYEQGDTFWGPLAQGKPIATEGAWGFIDQHIGDTVETLELFYLARIPVSLVAKVVESHTNKKIDPRVKLGASMFISAIAVSALELSGAAGGVPDPADLVGIAAAGIWASVGYEVIDYLFIPRETPIFEQWYEKISRTAKSIHGISKNVIAKLDNWVDTLGNTISEKGDGAIIKLDGNLGDLNDRLGIVEAKLNKVFPTDPPKKV